MLQGFKEFILRGNIIDLAVAVVIGSAFAAVVDVVVSSLITPILAVIGDPEAGGLVLKLNADNSSTWIDFSAMLNALIVFVITAAVVYFVFVVPTNKLATLRARDEEPEPEAVPEDVLVLREIRDMLANRDTTT